MRHASVNLDWPAECGGLAIPYAHAEATYGWRIIASIRMSPPQPAANFHAIGRRMPNATLTLRRKPGFGRGA